MKLENYEVHLPNYSIGDRIYDKIGPVCESYGKKVLIIGGRRALNAAEDKIRAYVAKQIWRSSEQSFMGQTVLTQPWKNCVKCRNTKRQIWYLAWEEERH